MRVSKNVGRREGCKKLPDWLGRIDACPIRDAVPAADANMGGPGAVEVVVAVTGAEIEKLAAPVVVSGIFPAEIEGQESRFRMFFGA